MLAIPPRTITRLADRLERAYLRHWPRIEAREISPGIWTTAAAQLVEAHRSRPEIPLDPELFIAAQARPPQRCPSLGRELIRPVALRNYVSVVRQIVSSLHREVMTEIFRAETLIEAGAPIEKALAECGRRVSPLGRYILACRHRRDDLVGVYREAACRQHEACPLYRLAVAELLPAEAYPVPSLLDDSAHLSHACGVQFTSFSMN